MQLIISQYDASITIVEIPIEKWKIIDLFLGFDNMTLKFHLTI